MTLDPTQVKSFLISVTLWGVLVSAFATFMPHIYSNIFGTTSQAQIVQGAMQAVGIVITIYGRFRATKTITLTGK